MRKKDIVEKYINGMNKRDWNLISRNDDFVTLEKEKISNNFMNTFFKEDVFMAILMGFWFIYLSVEIVKLYNKNFIDIISNYSIMIMIGLGIILNIVNLVEIVEKIYGLIKFRVNVVENKLIYKISVKQIKIRTTVEKILIILGVLIFASYINYSAKDYFYTDNIKDSDLPLTLSDFNIKMEKDKDNNLSVGKTFLSSNVNFSQYTYKNAQEDESDKCIWGQIFTSKSPYIMKKSLNNILENSSIDPSYKKSSNKEEIKNWACKELYVDNYNDRVVVYENRIISVGGSIDFSKENIEKIKNACFELD